MYSIHEISGSGFIQFLIKKHHTEILLIFHKPHSLVIILSMSLNSCLLGYKKNRLALEIQFFKLLILTIIVVVIKYFWFWAKSIYLKFCFIKMKRFALIVLIFPRPPKNISLAIKTEFVSGHIILKFLEFKFKTLLFFFNKNNLISIKITSALQLSVFVCLICLLKTVLRIICEFVCTW